MRNSRWPPLYRASLGLPQTGVNYYLPPSWMTIEFTVASEVRRNISPSLITTCFPESCPGSQFLRRGFWSGQFSTKHHNTDRESNPTRCKKTTWQAKPRNSCHWTQVCMESKESLDLLPLEWKSHPFPNTRGMNSLFQYIKKKKCYHKGQPFQDKNEVPLTTYFGNKQQ